MANKITVTSAGTVVNANVTPDSTMYYSNKSKEWAISEKIVDNTDYSSKYYANESKKQADISTAKATEVVESGNTAVSNIESARDNAITDITNQESLSVDNVNTAGATQVSSVNKAGATQVANVNSAGATQVNLAKEQVTLATNQANIATNKTSEVVASGNTALSNIATAKNNAITTITTQETTSKNNVIVIGNEQVERVNLTGVDNRTPIFTKSEIGTNEGVYQNVYDLKHSTFDRSKFTVVGSPNITDDGIASGFSNSNYLNSPNLTTSGDKYEISFEFNSKNTVATATQIMYVLRDNPNSNEGLLMVYKNAQNNISIAQPSVYGTQYFFVAIVQNNNTRARIDITYVKSQGRIQVNYYENGILIKSGSTTTTADWSNISFVRFGYSSYSGFQGSIDLKQFSITVDGKEVFSGNKTGLDVIKPDNYTVVGSPVISEDGVASEFGQNTKITTSHSISTLNKTINIKFRFKLNSTPSASTWIAGFFGTRLDTGTSITGAYLFYVDSRCQLSTYINANGSDYLNDTLKTKSLSINTYYDVSLSFTTTVSGSTNTLKVYQNDTLIFNNTASSTKGISLLELCELGNERYLPSSYLDGSIDLNSFKIYIDGNLVYQPCLKIPYTESKTGSKIVDVAYRDRVIDLYEQEGQAGYYTIDEENKNFTLPMGEVYGMIGQRSLISSTVTETNRIDIYSDKTCLICGSVATAGTINLPIELANNNYFITLSTSAKTATSFTTTATGDYILIGKVI